MRRRRRRGEPGGPLSEDERTDLGKTAGKVWKRLASDTHR